MRIPPLNIKILLESNPLKSRILVGRLAVCFFSPIAASGQPGKPVSHARIICKGNSGGPKEGGSDIGQHEGLSM